MTMDDGYCTDPDCDDQNPDEVHFHIETRAPEPTGGGHAVIEDRRAYFWPGDSPAVLPHEGEDPAAAGWKELGWVDEIHDFEGDAYTTKVEAQFRFYYEATQNISPPRRPTYPPIDIDQVKWPATPRNPKGNRALDYATEILGEAELLDWQRRFLDKYLSITGLDNQIRAVTPPGMIGTVYAEINKLTRETPATQEFAREIVYNRMAVTGNPRSIINAPPTLDNLQLELRMLRRHQRGAP